MCLILILGLLLCSNFHPATPARSFDAEIMNIDFKVHDPAYIAQANASLITYKGHKAIHVEIELSKVVKSFKAKIVAYTPRQKLPLIDFTIDGCEALRNKPDRPTLVKVLMKSLLLDSKLPNNCPLKERELYYVQHFYINPELLPPYTPMMNVFSNWTIFFEKTLSLSYAANMEFKRK